jgi:hypothetical protein
MRSGGSHERALGLLVSALDDKPALVLDAEKEVALAPLRGVSEYETAKDRAKAALRDMQAAGEAVGT